MAFVVFGTKSVPLCCLVQFTCRGSGTRVCFCLHIALLLLCVWVVLRSVFVETTVLHHVWASSAACPKQRGYMFRCVRYSNGDPRRCVFARVLFLCLTLPELLQRSFESPVHIDLPPFFPMISFFVAHTRSAYIHTLQTPLTQHIFSGVLPALSRIFSTRASDNNSSRFVCIRGSAALL